MLPSAFGKHDTWLTVKVEGGARFHHEPLVGGPHFTSSTEPLRRNPLAQFAGGTKSQRTSGTDALED